MSWPLSGRYGTLGKKWGRRHAICGGCMGSRGRAYQTCQACTLEIGTSIETMACGT